MSISIHNYVGIYELHQFYSDAVKNNKVKLPIQ